MSNRPEVTLDLEFSDNRFLSQLFGEHDQFLRKIEEALGIALIARGNRIIVVGPQEAVDLAREILNKLYQRLQRGMTLTVAEVDAALRFSQGNDKGLVKLHQAFIDIPGKRRTVEARTPNQEIYIKTLQTYDLVFGIGPAGTGKTYLAVAQAVSELLSGKAQRIILSRPAVEAGERLGFLPGDLREKVDPYLRPLYDALYDMMPFEQVAKRLASGEIEVAPVAFMRGRTLSKSYVILDEAQNATAAQMKMFLTRLGEDSKMVVTGDLTQIDLPSGVQSGLRQAVDVLKDIREVSTIYFTEKDVVRHDLVGKIVQAYDKFDLKK